MGRPQKPDVYKANATALGDMAKPLRDAATKMLESADRVHTTVYDFDWEGEAKNAADGRADRELVQDRAVAAAQLALADAYENGAKTMQPMIDGLKSKAQGLEADNFSVSDDWAVKDTYDYDAAARVLKMMGFNNQEINDMLDPVKTSRANTATAETTNLGRLADELGVADENTAKAINEAKAALADAAPKSGMAPGQSWDMGPVGGTGANIPGVGAADLGEVVQLPDGSYVAIFGDSFSGNKMGVGDHYPSVAVPVKFDENGKMIITGPPLTGPDGSPNVLFPPPPGIGEAQGKDNLPAGSIRMSDGTTYVMAAGTTALKPDGGSWLVKVTDPRQGWQQIDGSWRSSNPYLPDGRTPNPKYSPVTQISGFQSSKDGMVYIAADSFDRSTGVTMYRVDPEHVTDRSAWQPWTGTGWGDPTGTAAPMSRTPFGELSFREVEGRAVLSGFNGHQGGNTGTVEVRVANSPAEIFSNSTPTVVAQQSDQNAPNYLPQNYGGYIMPIPGMTLDNLDILVSQWNTTTNVPYNVQEFQVNPNR
ncbi:hypothetical protein C1Y40_04209 [Mycobacterium talmoniae]|uniref:DUF4185 domain-containing protein n=2 Tax=Mycobacterium talmoniae TaxID=1858794 RepID=A0A1S1NME4_9MYCO|nr:DUF4185 domain-containing protein [Mycobacterium eburneum]OHV05120.1 hypothetical protein BKN37_07020 [Mycobacterium talmoniae]PQM45618.1 hypothetical protein C1Y40_04209 [Mycobacterium talmoniae]